VTDEAWAPLASRTLIKARADLYRSVRAFFDARGVLEVETPALSRHATVDRHIESFAVAAPAAPRATSGYLHTSPEFAMKRLLAAGSGPIYQIARVFRAEEQGRHHNPEFSLLEWYRPGLNHHQLMDEVAALLTALGVAGAPFPRVGYHEAFRRFADLDPDAAPLARLRDLPQAAAFGDTDDRDLLLDLWMSHIVGPQLGRSTPCFLLDFPASQAALARVENDRAQRFELFWNGLELANGFHELTDAAEQQRRFAADQAWRAQQGRAVPPYDPHLIAALAHGLPDCAGVAIGLDRLLMCLNGCSSLAETLTFPADRA